MVLEMFLQFYMNFGQVNACYEDYFQNYVCLQYNSFRVMLVIHATYPGSDLKTIAPTIAPTRKFVY